MLEFHIGTIIFQIVTLIIILAVIVLLIFVIIKRLRPKHIEEQYREILKELREIKEKLSDKS